MEEEHYGDAILSRRPLELVRSEQLPGMSNREPRGAIWVEFTWPSGQRVQLINTHLSIYPSERLVQAQAIADSWVADAAEKGPTILCGDFNASPSSRTYRELAKDLIDVQTSSEAWPTSATWLSPRPIARIDHIFATSHFHVKFANVVKSQLAKVASDHLPLITDLALLESQSVDPSTLSRTEINSTDSLVLKSR